MPHGDTHAWPHPDRPLGPWAAPAPGRTTDDTTGHETASATGNTTGHAVDDTLGEVPYGTEPLGPYGTTEHGPGTRSRPGHHGDLRRLRRTYRIQRRTTTFLALGYFTAFLILSAQYPALMARPLVGGLPTGLVLALSHVPVTWLAVLLYERTARRYVDPLALRVTRHAPWATETGREQGR